MVIEVAASDVAPLSMPNDAPPAAEISPLVPEAEPPPPVVRIPAPHEVVLPQAELPPPVELKPPTRPAERRSPQPPAPKVTAPPPAPAPAPNVAAAQPGASRDQLQAALLIWQRALLAHLERHKRHPADALLRPGQVATTYVLIVMERSGRVIAVQTERSSGVIAFDREGIERVWRAQPPPPLPPGDLGNTIEPIVPDGIQPPLTAGAFILTTISHTEAARMMAPLPIRPATGEVV